MAQRPYHDSAVNKPTTGSAVLCFLLCPGIETPKRETAFRYGQPAVFTAYYRDQLSSQTSTYRIYKPDSCRVVLTHHSTAACQCSLVPVLVLFSLRPRVRRYLAIPGDFRTR